MLRRALLGIRTCPHVFGGHRDIRWRHSWGEGRFRVCPYPQECCRTPREIGERRRPKVALWQELNERPEAGFVIVGLREAE